MIGWFKKPKVEFITDLPAVLYSYPIVPIRKVKPEWFNEEVKDYAAKAAKGLTPESLQLTSIAKCKGISKLFRTGWVVSTWQDIFVDADENGGFTWKTPVDQKALISRSLVEHHSFDTFAKCPHLSKQVPILKIQTPWAVIIPDGYSIMQLPVPYQNHDMFSTAPGIFSHAFGIMELNIQLFWHARQPTIVKAGTPIAHLVLVKDEAIPFELREGTPKELKRLETERTLKQNTYRINYKDMLTRLKLIREDNK